MQDPKQITTPAGGASVPLFFWPGQAGLAARLTARLSGPGPEAYDAAQVRRLLAEAKRVVVLWRAPDGDLAECLTTGAPAAQALHGWKDMARGLIALVRQNRRSVILAEAGGVLRGGHVALFTRLGLSDPEAGLAAEPVPALPLALARLAVAQDPELARLLEDLTSASLPAPDLDPGAIVDLVIAEAGQATSGPAPDLEALAQVAARQEAALMEAAQAQDAALSEAQRQADAALAEMAAERDAALAAQEALRADLAASRAEAEQRQAAQDQAMADATRQMAQLQDRFARQDDFVAEVSATRAAFAQDLARLNALGADAAALSVRLAARDQELALLSALAGTDEAALTVLSDAVGEVAQQRAALRDSQISVLQQDLAKSRAEQTLFREEVARLRLAAEADQRKIAAAVAEQSKSGTDIAARLAAEQALTKRLAAVVADVHKVLRAPTEPALTAVPGSPEWDRATTAALAALRREIDQRLRTERELDSLRRQQDAHSRREADVAINARLFAQMSEETTAALDSIARLTAAKPAQA